eukprot:952657-Prorocentrum_minimum.AAC.1
MATLGHFGQVREGMRYKVLLHIAAQATYLAVLYCCQIELSWRLIERWMELLDPWMDLQHDLGLFQEPDGLRCVVGVRE